MPCLAKWIRTLARSSASSPAAPTLNSSGNIAANPTGVCFVAGIPNARSWALTRAGIEFFFCGMTAGYPVP